ncbi:hypothetical protein ACIP5Y_18715 [Nocardia sp. NPDC088792]|uniref:hypothetical protein n=1 Tax=Nocardia sp. NPDC088792 TaxID=3364332 RepID=UPI0037F9E2B0
MTALHTHYTTLLITLGLATLGWTAGCADSTGATEPGDPPPIQSPDGPTVTSASAQRLCDMLGPDVDAWRAEGPTFAKIALNNAVQDWALHNNGINIAVTLNRSVVDRVTIATCPAVRDALLTALQTSDLASGLVGFQR